MTEKMSQFQRKHYFIDRKFQGRFMLIFFIPMLIMLGFLLFTLYFATNTIVNTTTRIIKRDIENTVLLELQDQTSPSIEKYQSLIGNVQTYVKTFSNSKELKDELMTVLLWVFGAGVFLVIIQIVFMTIFFSHKVAGPVYRMECVCHNIIQGKYTDEIHLRKGDEMMNLASLFNSAVKITRNRIMSLVYADTEEKRKEIASKITL